MAGIDNLVKGAVGTLAKDKVSSYLSPSQMDFITFALNPQAYLLDKGVTAAADALGYGSQYRELKGGAQDEKEYYKEVMRDTIGDMLPGGVGDFVRANPKNSEIDSSPAGTYTAWNPDTQSFEEQQSNNPVTVFDQFAADRFASGFDVTSPYNVASNTYIGPQTPGSIQTQINTTDLLELLEPYRSSETPEMTTTGIKEIAPAGSTIDTDIDAIIPSGAGGDFVSRADSLMDSGGTMDYSDVFGSSYGGGGGGGGGKYYDDFSSQAYAKGGKTCGCKH